MSIYTTRLLDSETNEPLTPKELNLTEEQYLAYVSQSLGIPGEGHVRVRASPTGRTRRVYAEAEARAMIVYTSAHGERLRFDQAHNDSETWIVYRYTEGGWFFARTVTCDLDAVPIADQPAELVRAIGGQL